MEVAPGATCPRHVRLAAAYEMQPDLALLPGLVMQTQPVLPVLVTQTQPVFVAELAAIHLAQRLFCAMA
ncbi:hypothetical protein QS306_01230 [Paraburkholderia bonniea]|uniref:hypothetical protein n=1 Tax=Paraburkholderia bonniea TaxID=2152891 RepID=UPI0012921882|nr:hypothetical protein [Paraburkholderia bonniea]WJF90339.1 hypothetical protein QS306_01230 [Paraburkholderia bonniea]WJF93654.1 hypothetical protein QS308_01230 [Paraburkholderia bonniea]